MGRKRFIKLVSIILLSSLTLVGCGANKGKGTISILNVSYDATRELYKDYNKVFEKHWFEITGKKVEIQQSHGGSGAQSRAIKDGLEADVATLALAGDFKNMIKENMISKDWNTKLPNNSTPYTSTIVFLVRKGNPKNIKDWDDLVKDGISVVTPNPKTSGGARWNYLAAYGYALSHNNNDQNIAKQFVKKLYKNVGVLDSGARQASTTFVQNGIGDVLLSWENEALLALKEDGSDNYELIVPSMSILAEPSVTVVDSVTNKKGTKEVSNEYLKYLYSDEGQEIIAKNFYRPRNEKIGEKYKNQFQKLDLFTIDNVFGGWEKAQKEHFDDGGTFDQIYSK